MDLMETEFLIVGGGIVGLTIARELLQIGADKITIIDKEPALGLHASGRNSGVLHAGIYYPPNTLKAELCLKGNLLLQEYCEINHLPLMKCGKVIVASNSQELSTLYELHERAKQNQADVYLLDENELKKIEPYAKTFEKALFSRYTAIVDNKAILNALQKELLKSGRVKLLFNIAFIGLKNEFTAKTSRCLISFKQFINAGGAYSDKIAQAFDIAKEYYLIPFKGIYKKIIPSMSYLVNGNIYPVPNLEHPFLGVHFTKNIHGEIYVGPTAIPAFGRENYHTFRGIDSEAFKIIFNEIILFFSNSKFRKVAFEEPKKYLSSYFYQDAKKLVTELKPEWLIPTSKIGIRPQLIDVHKKELVMDFLVIKEKHSLHILNAISPAFTSSFTFAKYIVKELHRPAFSRNIAL